MQLLVVMVHALAYWPARHKCACRNRNNPTTGRCSRNRWVAYLANLRTVRQTRTCAGHRQGRPRYNFRRGMSESNPGCRINWEQ